MKKIIFTFIILFNIFNLNTAYAKSSTVSSGIVKYECQSGKKVLVKYGFNKEGLPTYASSYINGTSRYMPINLDRSDDVDTFFGTENTYSLSSEQMTKNNYRQQSIMIMSPSQQILFKDCRAR